MNKNVKIIELFSGIGGFTKGFEDAGYTIEEHYYSEIDKHAIANYKYNYPNAEYIGSVVDINGENYSNCNILTFGFPCQDLSLAGKRLGFKGKRSSLFYHAARILREGQIETFIWENVMGLLSSNKGADIQSVCEELYLSGYVFDFEEQNTKWYLPQNRRRIYCIGHNIKKMHKWIISEQNGQNQKYFLYRKIIKSWVLNKYQKYLTEVLNQSEQRQKELVLEFYFQKEQKMLNGVNLKKRLSEIINSLPFENWKYCYQTVLELLLKQCDINSDALIVQNLNSLQEVINTCGTKEEMEKRKSFLSIEKLLKMLLEENLKAVNKSIILTLINSTTKLKTFTYAKMQLNIELFIIQLSLLYPQCWKEELSDLIETQRNTNYAKIRENEIRNFKKNNNAPVQLSIFEEIGDDTNGHLADRSEPGVFPITEEIGVHHERHSKKTNQVASTLNANDEKSWVGNFVKVKSATKSGFEVAESGDSINLSNPNSETRRGRVGKGVAQTLDCACNQGVMIGAFRGRNPENPTSRKSGLPTEQMLEINKEGVSNTLTSVQKDNVVITQKPRGNNKGADFEICPTISANSFEHNNHINFLSEPTHKHGEERIYTENAPTIQSRYGTGGDNIPYVNNIRRLTEIECERLQGFPDNFTEYGNYDGVIKKIPKTQRYKMLGNAVTVKVVEEIAKRLNLE